MPRGDKSSYTDKQKRQAEHIEESEKKSGRGGKTAARIAWATVNKETGGGKKSGSGKGKKANTSPSKKGGKIGGSKIGGNKKGPHKSTAKTPGSAIKKSSSASRKPGQKKSTSKAKK